MESDVSLLGCSALRNSLKSVSSLTLTTTVSARFELTDTASGSSTVKEYSANTFTRTWTRESSSTPYEIANTVPAAGKFRLVNECCCWKCRWTTIIRSLTSTIQTNKIAFLRSLKPRIDQVVVGQYVGYPQELHVNPSSITETYAYVPCSFYQHGNCFYRRSSGGNKRHLADLLRNHF